MKWHLAIMAACLIGLVIIKFIGDGRHFKQSDSGERSDH